MDIEYKSYRITDISTQILEFLESLGKNVWQGQVSTRSSWQGSAWSCKSEAKTEVKIQAVGARNWNVSW